MTIKVIQASLIWENRQLNLDKFDRLLEAGTNDADLVVLPEMFTTGFTMNPAAFAETMDGPSVQWMREHAAGGRYALCGSLIIAGDGCYFNRMVFVKPDGSISHYDKHHLHSISGEDMVYTPGNEQVTVRYMDFGINLQVCYDLRFPVWSRNRGGTDIIIYSANWPGVRSFAWNSLLVARAIENQCYVIGCNRTGANPDGTSYSGDSLVIGPKGETLAAALPDAEMIISAEISKEYLDRYRKEMPVWKDADDFTLNTGSGLVI